MTVAVGSALDEAATTPGGSTDGLADPSSADAGEGGRAVLAQRHVLVGGQPVAASLAAHGRGRHTVRFDAETARVVLEPGQRAVSGTRVREVLVDGFRFEVEVESARRVKLRERATRGRSATATDGPVEVRAVIPGKVLSVSVAPGDVVEPGQELLVVEAMKMQNELRSPRGGTIDRVGITPGASIEVGDILVVISERRPG
jgi:biotin carboxyl carrier protein